MEKEIYAVIRAMVLEGGKPAKEVAREVGKPYPTLLREINPTDPSAKLGVELLVPLMRACNSVLPLRHMAASMGHRVTALPEEDASGRSLPERLLDSYEVLVRYHRAIREGWSAEKVAELREMVIQQAQKDFVGYLQARKGE